MVSAHAMRKIRAVLIIVLLIAIIWLISKAGSQTETAILTFTVENDTFGEEVEQLLDVLDEHQVNGTFFITGSWAQTHPEIVDRIAQEHEIGCMTMSGVRLPHASDIDAEVRGCKETIENISGVVVQGFRAPSSEINGEAFAAIAENYAYDSSLYRRYEWFWEAPPLLEIPISSVLFLPMNDGLGVRTLRLGDLYYYLVRKARQPAVVLSFTPSLLTDHMLDFEYLIDHYKEEGIAVKNIAALSDQTTEDTGVE